MCVFDSLPKHRELATARYKKLPGPCGSVFAENKDLALVEVCTRAGHGEGARWVTESHARDGELAFNRQVQLDRKRGRLDHACNDDEGLLGARFG